MKKILLILVVSLASIPGMAQRDKIIKAGLEGLRGSVMLGEQVSRQIAKAEMASPLVFPLEFVNLPATVAANRTIPSVLVMRPDEIQKFNISPELKTVQAEFFPSNKLERHMKEFDDLELYNTVSGGSIFHRGMVLPDLQSLKDIFTKGLEWKKTSYNRIFASRYLAVALDHAYINHGQLPVLVQIPETDRLLFTNVMGGDDWTVTFGRDIPADMLSRTMVFLKINNKPGWYDVRLQNEMFVFSPISMYSVGLK